MVMMVTLTLTMHQIHFQLTNKSDVQVSDLAALVTRNRCTRKAVNEPLSILNKNGLSSLPKDCKTLQNP